MITGLHTIMFSPRAEAIRSFCRDVLEWPYVDAHDGWLIFAAPPAELAVHPLMTDDDAPHHELWLMCDDLVATMAELTAKGVTFVGDPEHARFGDFVHIALPDGGRLSLYQPNHASPLSAT